MDKLLKPIFIIFIIIAMFSLSSCNFKGLSHWIKLKGQIRKEVDQMMECIKNEDKEGLLELFCEDVRETHREETLKEIEDAFDFIDGKVVSYKNYSFGYSEHISHGMVVSGSYSPGYYEVKTDTGKNYEVFFCYHYNGEEFGESPRLDGINHIRILDKDKHIVIGHKY